MNFDDLRRYTKARIGLGHAGAGLPTKEWLLFSLHHAMAVDAVLALWDLDKQIKELSTIKIRGRMIRTKATTRQEYLLRPDLGGLLNDDSKRILEDQGADQDSTVIIASNGLSSTAVKSHLTQFLAVLLQYFHQEKWHLCHNEVLLIPDARVALIDDIGDLLKPKLGIVIIGERPGLSAADSLAVYLTFRPRSGLSNADRNCISNIRPPHGLGYVEAAEKLCSLMKGALLRKLSGVLLKDIVSRQDQLDQKHDCTK